MTAPNLEQIIANHERVRRMRLATCRCGWEEPIHDRDVTALHAAHVVAAIRDSGHTVIALPESADATLARIQAVCADVDQDGGHSGPTLARHILNIIGGEA